MRMANSEIYEDLNFGRELGLIHKLILLGRRLRVGRRFWTALDDNSTFQKVIDLVENEHCLRDNAVIDVDYDVNLDTVDSIEVNMPGTLKSQTGTHWTGCAEIKMELIQFDKTNRMELGEIEDALIPTFRTANLYELLAYAKEAKIIGVITREPIVALGFSLTIVSQSKVISGFPYIRFEHGIPVLKITTVNSFGNEWLFLTAKQELSK